MMLTVLTLAFYLSSLWCFTFVNCSAVFHVNDLNNKCVIKKYIAKFIIATCVGTKPTETLFPINVLSCFPVWAN